MASTKRDNPTTEGQEPEAKRSKIAFIESPQFQENLRVVLNPADCNLDFNIEDDGLTGHALYEQGFAYCWSGARGNIGIRGGKYCFGCKIVSGQPVDMEDTPFDQRNVCRVGISRGDDPVGNLGETEHSYGFGGTGKFSNCGRFLEYGERFGIGDTIVCLVDLDSKPSGSIEFSKNGKWLGIAKHFDKQSALFPHVLVKNTVVKMQFSMEDGLVLEEGYRPWACAVKDGNAVIGPCFSDPKDCEVLMMVGLPASGKTTWAENWVREHPEKRYILLGTNLALDQMKVPGLMRKNNYSERFDRLMERATGIFNTLLSRASKVPRNYIFDQTNVYKSARKRKLKPFAFCHKIAVVVFPKPEELKLRAEKRFKEMGKEVPAEAVNEMLANFVLPMSKDMHGANEYFDQVVFTELNRVEAQHHLDEMKCALAMASGEKSKSDGSVHYAWEASVHSYSRMPAFSSPGPGHASAGYSNPSLGVQRVAPGDSWMGPPVPSVHPYPANVNSGYTDRDESFAGSHQGSLNPMPFRDAYHESYSSYTSPLPRNDFTRYTYTPDTRHYAPQSYGTPTAHNPGSAYGTPNPRPPANFSANIQHPGAAPYGPTPWYY